MPFSTACSNEQQVRGDWSGAFTTAAGNPAQVEGATVVAVVSGDGTFTQTGDHAGIFVSGTAAGDTVYSLSADADLGAGVVTITDTVTLTVTAANAANFGVTFSAPEPK